MPTIPFRSSLLLFAMVLVTGCAVSANPSEDVPAEHSAKPGAGSTNKSCSNPLNLAGCACSTPGETRACYTGPKSTMNIGTCKDGQQKCTAVGEFATWSSCKGDVVPAAEVCTGGGIDTNCNGKRGCDEIACAGVVGCCTPGTDRPCYDGPSGTGSVGACHDGINVCNAQGAWDLACTGEALPSLEAGHCTDGIDNDCNGLVDCDDPACSTSAGCMPQQACSPGAQMSCYIGPYGTFGVGACRGGVFTCASDGSGWSTCQGSVVPGSEAGHCHDGVDNDCDGRVDCADPECAGDPTCCTPTPGIDSTIYATSADTLFKINPATWGKIAVGYYNAPGGDRMTDLAMTPNGNVYTLSGTALYSVNTSTGQATKLVSLGGTLNNGLTFLADNTLLASDAGGTLKHVNPSTGSITTIGTYCGGSVCGAQHGYGSSGDLVAVSDGTLYGVSATDAVGNDRSSNNLLVRINRTTGRATEVGPIGFANVFGLAFYGGMVLGFDYLGNIIKIDPATGAGTRLSQQSGTNFFGGTTSPLMPPSGCP